MQPGGSLPHSQKPITTQIAPSGSASDMAFISKFLGSNLGWNTDNPDWGMSLFSSILLGKFFSKVKKK